jgi:hypothetical protein
MEETLWNSSISQQAIKEINCFTDTYQQCCVNHNDLLRFRCQFRLWKVPVPDPNSEPYPDHILAQFFPNFLLLNLVFYKKQHCFQKVVIHFLNILLLYSISCWNRNRIRNWNWKPECIAGSSSGSVSAQAKSCGSCGSGFDSTTLLNRP